MTFAEKLVAARRAKGWVQETLGHRCGLQQSHIAHFERGSRKPNLDNFAAIVRALGVDANSLLPDPEASAS
ncbi:MAG: helix-turn-helix transcriptional regulator [Pseudomonadota bacterium]